MSSTDGYVRLAVDDDFEHLLTFREGLAQEADMRETLWEIYKALAEMRRSGEYPGYMCAGRDDVTQDEIITGPYGTN